MDCPIYITITAILDDNLWAVSYVTNVNRNPKTREVIYIPARRKTHFRAGKILREVLKRELE